MDRLVEVDLRGTALLDPPGHHQQPVDDPGEAVDLRVGRFELTPDLLRRRAGHRRLDAKLHPGEWGPKLVRGVRHELPLGLHARLQPVGLVVEGSSELDNLARPLIGFRARGEVSAPEALGYGGQVREWPAEGSGEG